MKIDHGSGPDAPILIDHRGKGAQLNLDASDRRIRVLRVIARMNVGGPAFHVSLLTGRLDSTRYDSLLASGKIGPGEASFDELACRYEARCVWLPNLGPQVAPFGDVRSLVHLMRLMRSFRPDIVHTHTAKAGMIGRLAARLALGGSPVIVHTYHGHVLSGYFGPARNAVFRWLERQLGGLSDCLIGVSQSTVDELVTLGVAPREKFRAIALGLELDRFLELDSEVRGSFREELGVGRDEVLCVFVGRLVPIKRVDLLLKAVVVARAMGTPVKLAIVGDGELRKELEAKMSDLNLGGEVRFVGFRHDLENIAQATDIAVLASDNEGTPVSLIEAHAAGRPAVATDVGGVSDIVDNATGRLVPPGDAIRLGEAIAELSRDNAARAALGGAGRARVAARHTAGRLISDIDDLYSSLIAARRT